MILRPEILQHANIPKPLHGLSPRVIKGQAWWDKTRKAVYNKQDYCCIACGIHKSKAKYRQHIEAHEAYTIDYINGFMEIKEIIGLCHSCHSFIHCGRLSVMLGKGEVNYSKFKDVMLHGFRVLRKADLEPWFGQCMTYISALLANGETASRELVMRSSELQRKQEVGQMQQDWSEWYLLLDGKRYYSKFKSYEDWLNYYK